MLINIIFYKRYEEIFYNRKIFCFIIFINLVYLLNYNFFQSQILSILFLISLVDIYKKIIPNELIVILFILSLSRINLALYLDDLIAILLILSFFLISVYKKSIGMGDIKLLTMVYFLNGSTLLFKLIFNMSIMLFIISIFIFIKSKNHKQTIPLAPILLFAYFLSMGGL